MLASKFSMEGSFDFCDTELCLSPGGRHFRRSCPSSSSSSANSGRVPEEEDRGKAPLLEQDEQLTIFYNGRICICDVTELQARAIISMASREMGRKKESHGRQQASSLPPPVPETPSRAAQPPLLNRSLSMKRSLQTFLQKRKARSLECSSPYNDSHQKEPLPYHPPHAFLPVSHFMFVP